MISLARALRFSSGLRFIMSLPVLMVGLIVPAPTNEATLTTSGSRITIFPAIARCRPTMAENEMFWAASVTPVIRPVSC